MSEKQTRNLDNEFDNATVKKEVERLLKDGVNELSPDLVNRLKSKYNDDTIIDSVMEYFSDRHNKIVKVSNIFLDAFQNKYKDSFESMSLSKFMKRALKYKKRYELSDEEFDEVKRNFESRIYNTNNNLQNNVLYPNTNLSRTLGFPVVETTTKFRPSNTDDYVHLQDILKIYQAYKITHSHIVIQTMLYQNLAPEAMNGVFVNYRFNPNVYVHPMIAAFFLPKIHKIDERMLYANMAGIINTRHEGKRIITQPDYELFHSIIVDPSDTVCDYSSPLKDLKNRVEVQVQLWNNVYNLRSGKYYEPSSIDFLAYLDKCRGSQFDNPDLIYLSDEGVILRRLFNIFSFRPIIVNTMPIFGAITSNPLNLPVNTAMITAIPYITFKLPQIMQVSNQTQYSLEDARQQTQFHMENGAFVPKATQILETRGPLVFYVPRRSIGLSHNNVDPLLGPLAAFGNLAQNTNYYNQINTTPIDYNHVMTISSNNNSRDHFLRSVLIIDRVNDLSSNQHIAIGHVTFLFKYSMNQNNVISGVPLNILSYAPGNANTPDRNNKESTPIQDVQDSVKADELIKICGTVFIYAANPN